MPVFHLSLGASLGDRAENLRRAIVLLAPLGLPVDRVSSVYETEPVGAGAGPGWYLNVAARGVTPLAAGAALEGCLAVERAMGRKRSAPGGPRLIDIDLLLFGDEAHDAPGLTVPHPRLHLRRFVLEPLAEIDPGAFHSALRLTVAELLERLPGAWRVRRQGTLEDYRPTATVS